MHVAFFKLEVPDKPQHILTSKKNPHTTKPKHNFYNTVPVAGWAFGGVGMEAHIIFTEIILQFPTFKIISIYFYKLKG